VDIVSICILTAGNTRMYSSSSGGSAREANVTEKDSWQGCVGAQQPSLLASIQAGGRDPTEQDADLRWGTGQLPAPQDLHLDEGKGTKTPKLSDSFSILQDNGTCHRDLPISTLTQVCVP
jgi:hypothetical protein